MHLHNVYFWLKPSLTDQALATFTDGLRSLIAIDVVHAGQIGVPVDSEREVVIDDFSYSLHLQFENSEQERIYQAHDQHTLFIEQNKNAWLEVKVLDSSTIT